MTFKLLTDFVDPAREAAEDELGATFGDPRCCPRHPSVRTSSDDGMFDGVCGDCEGESELAAQMWDYDPANPERAHCALPVAPSAAEPMFRIATCQDVDDEICF